MGLLQLAGFNFTKAPGFKKEVNRCLKNGWKLVTGTGRPGDEISHLKKTFPSGVIQKLYKNGARYVHSADGKQVLARFNDGSIQKEVLHNGKSSLFEWVKTGAHQYNWKEIV